MTRCAWSVWNSATPLRACVRVAVDGTHCAQHAKLAAEIDASNRLAKARLDGALRKVVR